MEGSLLDQLGAEVLGIVTPVSICMLLVVLLVHTLVRNGGAAVPASSIAMLVYNEQETDSYSQKFGGALLNAVVFVGIVTVVTFLLVGLFYLRCTRALKWYMGFSAFMVLAYMGGAVAVILIQVFSIPIDVFTFVFLLYNFATVGVMAVFFCKMPIVFTQGYLVLIGVLVAYWFTMLPEWTTWSLLISMALYDVVAVLAPGGPLNMLVQLAIARDEDLPALVYEARPVTRNVQPYANGLTESNQQSGSGGPARSSQPSPQRTQRWRRRAAQATSTVASSNDTGSASSTELRLGPPPRQNQRDRTYDRLPDSEASQEQDGAPSVPSHEADSYPNELPGSTNWRRPSVGPSDAATPNEGSAGGDPAEQARPATSQSSITMDGMEAGTRINIDEILDDVVGDGDGDGGVLSGAIKLGLGDFIFYSVLVGRAAMYDMMTVYACYLAIVAGLGITLLLLAVWRRALPALPISVALGVFFYFLTRLLLDPFIVNLASHYVFF